MRGLLDLVGAIDSRWLLVAFLLALDVWAVGMVAASRGGRREKLLWTVVILLCPIVGCVLWYVVGPKPWLLRGRDRPAP